MQTHRTCHSNYPFHHLFILIIYELTAQNIIPSKCSNTTLYTISASFPIIFQEKCSMGKWVGVGKQCTVENENIGENCPRSKAGRPRLGQHWLTLYVFCCSGYNLHKVF